MTLDDASLHSPPADDAATGGDAQLLRSVSGMWCTSCALAIEHRLRRLPGVRRAGVDYLSATLLVEGRSEAVTPERVGAALARLGYRLCDLESAPDARARLDAESRTLAGRLLLAAIFGMWTMLASLLIYVGALPEPRLERVLAWVSGAFALPVVTLAAWPFYRAAWRTLRAGRPGMDALVSLGVMGALAVSLWLLSRGSAEVYFDTAVMLVLLLLAGRWVETLARYRGLRALEGLAALPERACRLREGSRGAGGHAPAGDGQENEGETVAAAEVAPGARIRVARGEILALDGELQDATARLDLALLTGESRPRTLTRGARLTAGCRNLGKPFTLRVTAGVGERRLDGLHRQVQALQAGKGELRRLAERFAAWLSPAAVVLALMTLAVLLLAGVAAEEAAVRALSVLVVACPCAVGLAVPLASLAGTARALDAGVVFRDSAAMELAGQARTVAFDKTGTLTRGTLQLTALHPAPGIGEERLLALAARAEWGSEHPLGLAIRAAAGEAGIAPGEAPETLIDYPGRGREAREADGTRLRIGALGWLGGEGTGVSGRGSAPPWATAVALTRDGDWLGSLWLEDDADPSASASLGALRRWGLTLALISGDRPALVRRLGHRLGLAPEACFGARSPEAKRHLVAALPGPALYVGDGINDAPALAAATVGVATANASAAAREAASIQLLGGGIRGVPAAIAIARSSRRVMRQNLALSGLYNALALGLAAWMVIPPQVAVLAMLASSLSVVGNAARLAVGKGGGWTMPGEERPGHPRRPAPPAPPG